LANSLVFKENLSSTDVIEIDEHTLEVLIEKI
jgi:hypothetical protein